MQTLLTCGIATATRHEDPREIFLRNDAAKIADASDVKIPLEKLPVEDMDFSDELRRRILAATSVLLKDCA